MAGIPFRCFALRALLFIENSVLDAGSMSRAMLSFQSSDPDTAGRRRPGPDTRHDGAGTRGRSPMTATPRWGITLPLRSLPAHEQRATVAALAPGRFVLGIGTSSPVIVEAWNGIELARPYQRARDTLVFLRAVLAGEKVSARYESFAISGFRLDPPPDQPPALALAALRPGMVRLAASLADGAITNWLAPSDVPAVRAVAGPGCELI